MKRLRKFILNLLPRCGFQISTARSEWGDTRCTRPKWHKGPHFWLYTGRKPHYEELRLYKRPRYRVSQANPRAESGAKGGAL